MVARNCCLKRRKLANVKFLFSLAPVRRLKFKREQTLATIIGYSSEKFYYLLVHYFLNISSRNRTRWNTEKSLNKFTEIVK